MKRVLGGIAGVLLLSGCAAPVGQTSLNLHQRAEFADGTTYTLSELKMSDRDSGRRTGAQKVPGPEVTVSLDLSNAGKPISAADVTMRFSYTGDDDREITPREVPGSDTAVPSGGHGQLTKTFVVADIPELYRSPFLRIVVSVPNYPTVTFSGNNP